MTSDPLGNLFARMRDSVDDSGPELDEPPETEPGAPAATAPTPPPRPSRVNDESAEDAADDVPEFERGEVFAVDPLDLDPVEPEPQWPVFGVAESVRLDDAGLRRRRDASVGAGVSELAPRVKRRLQDEQNELLDALRRQKGKIDASTAFPSAEQYLAEWASVLGPTVDDAYAAGRTLGGGRTRPAPARLVTRLAALLVGGLRERALASLDAVVREGPYDGAAEWQRVIAVAIGARYREFRSQDLDRALGDLLSAAFARGVFDAAPDGVLLRWVPAEVEHCPDCDDNALEPTVKGRPFPTGQLCAPAHPGCRCLVVPSPG
jgi:hypothetical protein